MAELAGGHADRTWDRRMREVVRPDLLILDDFTMRQMTAPQADDIYGLISERQGRSVIITSNWAPSKAHMFRRTRARWCLNSTGSKRIGRPPGRT
ncbi:ATP-binding protein [Streptomyces sp. NPDC057686]|uniref:ATP-binding protein n=1 Tax=Streptomyces sp. NPDC057686 TaxID=3346212 RepID=UPI0036CE6C5B